MLSARRMGWLPALLTLASACSLGSLDWLRSGTEGVDAGTGRDASTEVDSGTPDSPRAAPIGSPCSDDGDCDSGHCAGSVCCETACDGACQSCSAELTGGERDGTCGPARDGTDPKDDCQDDGPTSCRNDGQCDGQGACRKYPGCPPKLEVGARCTIDSECSSEHCVDGFCCDLACVGLCRACSAEKKGDSTPDGECGAVRAGADPDNECQQLLPSSCGTAGSCDGAGSCAKYSNETICKAAECESDTRLRNAWKCVDGACYDFSWHDCTPYPCDRGRAECRTSCSLAGSFPQCAPGFTCSGGRCRNPAGLSDGSPCSLDSQCASGYCTDNVCCETRCEALCMRCDGAGSSAAAGRCAQLECTDPEQECTKYNAKVCYRGQCYLTCPI